MLARALLSSRQWQQPCCRPTPCAYPPPAQPQGGRAGIGKGAAVLREVEVYDPATNAWRPSAPMVQQRCALAAAALGGRLYAVGGQSSRSCHATGTLRAAGWALGRASAAQWGCSLAACHAEQR